MFFCYIKFLLSYLYFIPLPGLSLQPYPSRLMCWGLVFLAQIFFAIICGLLFLVLLFGVELHCTSLLQQDSAWASYWSGSCNWIKCPSIHSLPYPGILCWSYNKRVPLDANMSGAPQAYFVISKVYFYFTLHPAWRWCITRLKYANRHTDQPVHLRCQLVWCLLTTQNFYTSREVGSWWSEHHI